MEINEKELHIVDVERGVLAATIETEEPVFTTLSTAAFVATPQRKASANTMKEKCHKFLVNLLELFSREPKSVERNVRTLIQELVDMKVEPEEFCVRLERLLKAAPQPSLVGFLKKSLPLLRQSMVTKEVIIDGVRPPPARLLYNAPNTQTFVHQTLQVSCDGSVVGLGSSALCSEPLPSSSASHSEALVPWLHDEELNLAASSAEGVEEHSNNSLRCDRTGRLKSHIDTHSGDKPFECTLCPYRCNQAGNLKRHMASHTGDKPFKCTVCSNSFSQASNLKTHMIKHTGDKPFECTVCSYGCARSGDLKRHMATHTGDKPFKCTLCPYKCIRANDLKLHMNTHTGDKPFQCNMCLNRFICAASLKRHMAKHTGDKSFKCTVCSYSSNHNSNLKAHMAKHTGDKPFKCSLCWRRSFSRASHLKRHMADKHTDEYDI